MRVRNYLSNYGRGGKAPPTFVLGVHDGDSLTSFNYPSDPARWGLPLLRNPPKMLKNFGTPNDTLTSLLTRISTTTSYASTIGAQFVLLRIGTNGVGTGDFATKYGQILDTYIASNLFVFACQIPPKQGADMRPLNTIVQAACASRTSMTRYVEDCDGLGDANYTLLAGMTVDGIHMSPVGAYTAGIAQAPILSDRFVTDPLVKDAGAAAAQWVTNPLMTGTGGTKAGGTGTVPNNVTVTSFGAGTSFVASVVAADVGDANQVPWLDIDPTFGGSSHSIEVRFDMAHPSIAADFSAVRTVDCIAEVALVALDTTNLTSLQLGPDLSRTYIQSTPKTQLTGNGTLTKTLVMRNAYERSGPSAYSANTLKAMFRIEASAATGGSAGHIRIRCASALGILN